MSNRNTDTFTSDGAQALADRIKAFWAERGYDVKTRIERSGFNKQMRSSYYVIRSDMKNGFPVRRLPGFA